MKKMLDKLKRWLSKDSDRINMDDVGVTTHIMQLIYKYWKVVKDSFWNLIQIVYNCRALFNNLKKVKDI